MKKLIAIMLLLLTIPCLTMAQKKELNQARSYIKSGKNLEQAEKLMAELLKNPLHQDNKKIYATWLDAIRKQYEQANEKFYLHQKQDTAAFFNLTSRMFRVAEALDSVDARPDKKGKIDIEYRKEHAKQMDVLRPNLFTAGSFHIRKSQFDKAFDYFEQYIDCMNQPLFTEQHYDSLDTRIPEAAYWATYCGHRMEQPVLTLRYRQLALRDSSKRAHTLQFVAEAWQKLNDDSLYLETLQQGFKEYPEFAYFFPRLADHYIQRQDYEGMLAVADKALAVNDSSEIFLFAKSTALLNLGKYDESITFSDRLLALNPQHAEAYFNAGTAYLNKALKYDTLTEKVQMKKTYQQARTYMEKYRKLAPAEKKKWAPALYRIYLNLNMGKQFDEIDNLMKK